MSAAARSAPTPEPRRALLRWAAGLGAVTAEAVAARECASLPSARGRLAAAEREGTMRAWRPLRDRPTLYTVTRAGLRAAGAAGLAPARVSPGSALHAIACARAAASLAGAFPALSVLGEPELRRRERELGRPLAVVRGGAPGAMPRRRHRPDLLLLDGRGGSAAGASAVAVEVELTVKAPERLAAICLAWARSREVAGAVYLASPEALAAVQRAVAAAGAGGRIAAVALDALG